MANSGDPSQAKMDQLLKIAEQRTSSLSRPAQQQQEQPSAPRGSSKDSELPQRIQGHKFSLKSVDEQYVLLLDAIDKLKLGSDIDLPEIVVLGDQSEGKSTVLEAIAGVKLPKGDKTCTKCLIRLCIRNKPKVHATIQFGDKSTDVGNQSDFSTKLKSIMDENFQDQISMRDTIDIKIDGPTRPNLTVVDAPGFKSDMSENDENMKALRDRLDNPNVVMVVVLKAINDIEASRGFGFALKLDQEFKRTVFVLTHCDNLMENKQTMVADMLKNRNTFAVNCYSPNNEFSSEDEKAFFEKQTFWRSQSQTNMGVEALISHLAENMFRILEPRKEEIHSRVLKLWSAQDKELQKLKDERDNTDRELKRFIREVNKEIEEHLTGSHRTQKNELFDGCKKLWNKFVQDLSKVVENVQNDLKAIVKSECEGQVGRELQNLPNYFPVLERIMQKHIIAEVEPLISELIGKIECTIQSNVEKIVKDKLKDREPLENFVNTKVREYLPKLRRDVADKIKMIISMETAVFQSPEWKDEKSKQKTQAEQSNDAEQEEQGLVETVIREGAEHFLPARAKVFVDPVIEGGKKLLGVATDPAEIVQKALRKECRQYINFLENRIANSIAKAMIKFMLQKMSVDIYDCVSDDDIDEDTKNLLKVEVDERIAHLEKSTAELQTLIKKF